jgi:hypothetical protein
LIARRQTAKGTTSSFQFRPRPHYYKFAAKKYEIRFKLQHDQQTDDSDNPSPTLKGTIIAMIFCAGIFGYAGYSGIQFPEEGRKDFFVVFLVLTSILFIVGSVFVWLDFNPQSILSVSEYRIRPMPIGQRIRCMGFLLGPFILGSTVYLIGGWQGSIQRGIVAALVAASLCGTTNLIQRLVKATKSRSN